MRNYINSAIKTRLLPCFFYFAISILQKNTNIAPANVLFNGCILFFSLSSLILRAGIYSFTLHHAYPLSPLPENDDTCKQNRMTPFRAPAFSHIRRQPPEYRFSPCRSSLFVELKKRGTRLFSSLYCFSSYWRLILLTLHHASPLSPLHTSGYGL